MSFAARHFGDELLDDADGSASKHRPKRQLPLACTQYYSADARYAPFRVIIDVSRFKSLTIARRRQVSRCHDYFFAISLPTLDDFGVSPARHWLIEISLCLEQPARDVRSALR